MMKKHLSKTSLSFLISSIIRTKKRYCLERISNVLLFQSLFYSNMILLNVTHVSISYITTLIVAKIDKYLTAVKMSTHFCSVKITEFVFFSKVANNLVYFNSFKNWK